MIYPGPVNRLAHVLLSMPSLEAARLARPLIPIVTGATGLTSSGYPYLDQAAFARFRDTIPHVLGSGPRVLAAVGHLVALADGLTPDEIPADERESFQRATRVVRTMLNTAAVTAPCDLWLLRHSLGALAEVGITERLVRGEAVDPATEPDLSAPDLDTDLHFVLSRGYVAHVGGAYRITSHPRAREVLAGIGPVRRLGPGAEGAPTDEIAAWTAAFSGESLPANVVEHLVWLGQTATDRASGPHDVWWATRHEIELGFRLLPVVRGLRAADRTDDLPAFDGPVGLAALAILQAAGVLAEHQITPIGRRVLHRGPGPFGIIGAYQPYMSRSVDLLRRGVADVWVQRGANVAASQAANRATFRQANDALDAMCAETGFSPTVFVEHAMGRGEATRQRWLRSPNLTFVGADLEDASIDAAIEQQAAGRLPEPMLFVRNADIGDPDSLLSAMREAGIDPTDAVMMVGNGFHEVRGQSDERMIAVFEGYERAGLVLMFTEAAALSAEDLLRTAFNTYNAGFQYVHELSGQGLRPATCGPEPRIGRKPPMSWTECARRAGFVRLERFCRKSRTIYPYPPPGGHNPSISVNHFFVPQKLAERLGVC